MSSAGTLVRVPPQELPIQVRNLLEPTIARPAQARFLIKRTHHGWGPAMWLIALLIGGGATTRATLLAGLDPDSGSQRFIFGAMAAVFLVSALFAARALILGFSERRAIRLGTYRQGLHVLGLEGLLIAGRDEHTWVPRELLPAAVDVTTHSRGAKVPGYTFVIVDVFGRVERLDCGQRTERMLTRWRDQAYLPDDAGWV